MSKKYYLKGTDEELKFGDKIELDMAKEKKGKTIHHHVECRFLPELVDLLLESDVIEQRETKHKPKGLSDEELVNCILVNLTALNEIITDLDERLTKIEGIIADKKKKK